MPVALLHITLLFPALYRVSTENILYISLVLYIYSSIHQCDCTNVAVHLIIPSSFSASYSHSGFAGADSNSYCLEPNLAPFTIDLH